MRVWKVRFVDTDDSDEARPFLCEIKTNKTRKQFEKLYYQARNEWYESGDSDLWYAITSMFERENIEWKILKADFEVNF